jgi:hypothetical protein
MTRIGSQRHKKITLVILVMVAVVKWGRGSTEIMHLRDQYVIGNKTVLGLTS